MQQVIWNTNMTFCTVDQSIVSMCQKERGPSRNWLSAPTASSSLCSALVGDRAHFARICGNRKQDITMSCTAIGAAHICCAPLSLRPLLLPTSPPPPPPAPRCSLPLPPSVAPAVSPIVAQTPIFLPFRSISLVLAATVQQCLPSKCCVIMFKVWACRRCRLWAAQAAVGSPVQLIIERQLLTKHQQNLNIISEISATYYQNTLKTLATNCVNQQNIRRKLVAEDCIDTSVS